MPAHRTCRVVIESADAVEHSFDADPDQPLLASAELAGIVMPSSCRNGTCRTCLRQLRSGTVSYRIAWPGLTPDEKKEGWILPCVAHPESDLRVAPPSQAAWWEG